MEFLLLVAKLNEVYFLFGYYNRKVFFRLLIVFLRIFVSHLIVSHKDRLYLKPTQDG